MTHVCTHHENAGICPLPIFPQRFGMITNPDGGPPLQWNSSLSLSLFGCHGDSFWVPLPAAVSGIVVSRKISPLDLEKRCAAMVRW